MSAPVPAAGAATPPAIHVFGDSHARFFFRSAFYIGRLNLPLPLRYEIHGKTIPASSVAGFRPGDRKLDVKDTIRAALPTAERMILAFGQVDLELGYYYRLAIKGETLTPESYVQWLLGIYRDFLDSLDLGDTQVALKGANLTALSPKPFALNYVLRIIESEDRQDTQAAKDRLRPLILSEDDQNAMHLEFNAGLQRIAHAQGHSYFDLVRETKGPHKAAPRLADRFRTAEFDHHLVDSVAVRRMHYIAAGQAFGLA